MTSIVNSRSNTVRFVITTMYKYRGNAKKTSAVLKPVILNNTILFYCSSVLTLLIERYSGL